MVDYIDLVKKALDVRNIAYVPYSNFSVGAALLSLKDDVFLGCNIESAAYSMCNCAERTAFFKAISEGIRSFKAIAIVGGKINSKPREFCFPCGACLQVMQEFCDEKTFEIILFDGTDLKVFKLSELLPFGFSDFRDQ